MSKSSREVAAVLCDTLREMRAEMIGLRMLITGEVMDLRSIAAGLAIRGVALEALLGDEEIINRAFIDELLPLCVCDADQRVAGWRSPAVEVEGGE